MTINRLTSMVLALLVSVVAGPVWAGGELNLYNWTNYTPPELLQKFEKETGIKVTLDTYDSNETLLAKLKSGASGYDAVVISGDFVPIFVAQNLIQPIDAAKLKGFANLKPKWQKRDWDPDARFTIPWVWGITSYTVNTAVYKGPTDSLKPLFEPPPELQGKLGMLGSPTEVMSLALLYLGKPECNTEPADLQALNALLQAQRPFVKVYNSDGIIERQSSGETAIHQQWSGSALRSRFELPSLKFVYAKEGVVGFMDNLAVPTSARNVENAKLFVSFMMQPENAAMLSAFTGYPNAVAGSDAFLDAKYAKAPEFNPPDDVKLTFIPTCSAQTIKAYDRIWTKLRQ